MKEQLAPLNMLYLGYVLNQMDTVSFNIEVNQADEMIWVFVES